jgi:mono/diheme cytochrome c family protein
MRRELGSVLAIVFVAAVATAACGQKDKGSANAVADTTAAVTTPAAAPAPGAQAAAAPVTVPPNLPGGVTGDMIQQGSQIFHTTGNCYTCHGVDAKGTALAPDLTTKPHLWVNEYPSYVDLITKGVPTPKKHPAPMPAMGGAQLTPDQVKAVAAYEWSLSHPQGGK